MILLLMQLAYLPDRKREYMIDDDAGSYDYEISADGRSDATNLDELVKDYKRNRRRGMLSWFKLKVYCCKFLLYFLLATLLTFSIKSLFVFHW